MLEFEENQHTSSGKTTATLDICCSSNIKRKYSASLQNDVNLAPGKRF